MDGRILLIIPDDVDRHRLEAVLAEQDCAVDAAPSVEVARPYLRENSYDAAVTETADPGADVPVLLAGLARMSSDASVVALVPETSSESVLRAVQAGAFDVMGTPVCDAAHFLHHVARAVRHCHLARVNGRLLKELQEKNRELENRVAQLSVAHEVLQSQAVALQVDLNRAMHIQRGMLPDSVPFPDRISFHARFHPLGKVGGDLYDIYRIDDRHAGAYVADTSGHGLSSAMLTVFLRHAIEPARTNSLARNPARLLDSVNRAVISQVPTRDLFVSMAYLVVNVEDGTVCYGTAGHPPLLLRRADGMIESRFLPGPVLGVNPRAAYGSDTFTLEEGDLVMMYTDGLVNATDIEGNRFGEDRLREALARGEGHTDTTVAAVASSLKQFTGLVPWDDDITFVALAREPQHAPLESPVIPVLPEIESDTEVSVRTAEQDRTVFISVVGAGSWRESQRVLQVCEESRNRGVPRVVLDLGRCARLDSTFYGVLHEIVVEFDEQCESTFEIQNIPAPLLEEFGELGLAAVMMHFRSEPLDLPEDMHKVDIEERPDRGAMGRLLLQAHEALVDADPANADRFAAVLNVLHQQAWKRNK